MKNYLTLMFGLAAVLWASAATADGNYISMFSGAVFLDDYNGGVVVPPAPTLNGTFSTGYVLGGAIGRRLAHGCRAEIEFAYRNNTGDEWNVNGVAVGALDGRINSYANMVNLIHDCDSLRIGPLTPYFGGGVGYAVIDGDFTTAVTTIDIDDTEFAYQGIAGVSGKFLPNVDFFSEYRFFATTNAQITSANGLINESVSYVTHNVFLGLRYHF